MSSSAPAPKRVIIVHDVLGTLFSLSEPISVLRSEFASQLGSDGAISARFAELIIMDWYHATQRDFTSLSLQSGAYTPIGEVFENTLPRVLLQAGLVPSASAPATEDQLHTARQEANDGTNPFGDEFTTRMMQSLQRLSPRPGMVQAFSHTYRRDARVELWGATNGSRALATALFEGALGQGVVKPDQSGTDGVSIWSCDDIRVAKPHPDVYKAIKERVLRGDSPQDVSLWFVASHTWDTDAASRAGFQTCWTTYEEFHPATGGEKGGFKSPQLRAKDLNEAAEKIGQYERRGPSASS